MAVEKRPFIWLCLLSIIAVAVWPLLGPPVNGDDLFLHYYRIPVLNSLWASGVPFARWMPHLNLGYGSPLFNFYPPLSAYLLTTLYWVSGQNGLLALDLFYASSLVLATVGMFLAGRRLYGALGGVVAAAAYVWSPYLLLQPYSRASLSNLLALALFPWAVWAVMRLAARPSGWRLGQTAVFVVAIFLSHVASSLLFIAPLLLVATAVAWPTWPRLRVVWLGIGLGLLLSAFFWLPALIEIGATRYTLEAGQVNYADFFGQIWTWPSTGIAGLANAPLPKSAGIVQQLLGVTAGVMAVLGWRLHRRQPTQIAWPTAVFSLIGGGLLFLTTPASQWLWATVSPLQALQFPWRLLDIPTFFLALAAGWWGHWLGRETAVWRTALLGIILTFMVANAVPYLAPPRIASLEKRPSMADASRVQQARAIYGLTAWGEYSSTAVREWSFDRTGGDGEKLTLLADKLGALPTGTAVGHTTPWRVVLETSANTPAQLLPVETHYFPGWQFTVDGEVTPLRVDGQGRMWLPVPDGSHRLTLAFRQTPIRIVAGWMSVLALMGWGILLLKMPQSREPGLPSPGEVVNGRFSLSLIQTAVWIGISTVAIGLLAGLNSPLLIHPTGEQIPGLAPPLTAGTLDGISLIGQSMRPDGTVILYWRAEKRPLADYTVQLTVVDARGVPVWSHLNPNPGQNVTGNWEAGQITRDLYQLPLADLPSPMAYRVEVAWLDSAGERVSDPVVVGTQTIRPTERVAEGGVETAVATFAEAIQLTAVQLPERLNSPLLQLELSWAALTPLGEDYTLFVHLLDADGELVSQSDGPPRGGAYPTSAWQPGDLVVDSRQWLPSVPPGSYEIQIGWYLPETAVRLPVDGPLGDRVSLGTVIIE